MIRQLCIFKDIGYIRLLVAAICLSWLPLPRIKLAEELWARYDAKVSSYFGEARYEYVSSNIYPHQVRIVFPGVFRNNHSPLHILYTPACCYLNLILACMVLRFRYKNFRQFFTSLMSGFLIGNSANCLRIAIGSSLRFIDMPLWISHDITNYTIGFGAVYFSMLFRDVPCKKPCQAGSISI